MPRKCIESGCQKGPIYNYPGESSRLYCKQHAKEGMVTAGQQRCQTNGCAKYALYNYPGETAKIYCQPHSKAGMINVKRRVCKQNSCSTQPYYNYAGETVGVYCAKHALNDMINVYAKKCKLCPKIPSYNFIGEKYGIYCKEHAAEGMVNVRNVSCEYDGCGKKASFGVDGGKIIYCNTHKQLEMINLRSRKCSYASCAKIALFNFKNSVRGLYCNEHKEDGMINLYAKICKAEDCNTVAAYDDYCAKHKPRGEISKIVGYRCKFKKCDKGASFNYTGLKPLYCSRHKEPNMCNVFAKHCKKSTCNITATFGYPGSHPEFCATHRKEGTKLQPMKRCNVRDCKEMALYGKKSPLYCEKHHTKDDINFVERKCIQCGLVSIVDRNNTCKYCDPDNWKVVRLAKQKEIETLFKRERLEYVSTDQMIDKGTCGKERPDFLFEAETHCVIVEVDEDQHKSRACECEQARMVNISQSLGMPTIFLRYNPDRYTVNGQVQDTLKSSRHKTLINWVVKLLEMESDELETHGFLSVIHLYFDDYNARHVLWEIVLDYES